MYQIPWTIPLTTKKLYISTRKVNSHLNHSFVCSSVHVCKQRTTQMLWAIAFNLRVVKFSVRFHFSIKFKCVVKYIISYIKYNKVIASCSSVMTACVKLLVCMENATTTNKESFRLRKEYRIWYKVIKTRGCGDLTFSGCGYVDSYSVSIK